MTNGRDHGPAPLEVPEPLPAPGLPGRSNAFLWLAGADAALITGPGERARHTAQGIGVLIAGLSSGAGVAAVVWYAFGLLPLVLTVAALWALAIMALDRALVSAPAPAHLGKRILKYLVLRVALFAAPLALITSQFLELMVFDGQVTREFALTAEERASDAHDEIIGTEGNPGTAPEWVQVTRLEEERNVLVYELAAAEQATRDAYSSWRDEGVEGAGGRPAGFGPVSEEKRRQYDEALSTQETLETESTARIAEIEARLRQLHRAVEDAADAAYDDELAVTPTLGTRLEVLEDLSREDPAVAAMRRNLFVMLLALEGFALTLKVGPQSNHDRLVIDRSGTTASTLETRIRGEAREAQKQQEEQEAIAELERETRRAAALREITFRNEVGIEDLEGRRTELRRTRTLRELDELEIDMQQAVGEVRLRTEYYAILHPLLDEAEDLRRRLLGDETLPFGGPDDAGQEAV